MPRPRLSAPNKIPPAMNSKSILCRFLLLPLALCLLTSPLSAATFGNFTYTDNGATITIDDYPDSATGAVVIPGTITGKPVVSIGYAAFSDCSSLTSESIPNSVTSIGDNAFANCSSMSSVTIPTSVTFIRNHVFYGCTSLEKAIFLGNAPSLGAGVFDGTSPQFTVVFIKWRTGFTTPT